MCDQAALWIDRRLPYVPYRQWTLTFPYDLRRLAAYDSEIANELIRRAAKLIERWQKRQGRERGVSDPIAAALVQVQRFQDGLGCNVHFHCLVPAGVWAPPSDGGKSLSFHPTAPPRDHELDALALHLETAVVKWLKRLYDEREEATPDEPAAGGWRLADLARLSNAAPSASHGPPSSVCEASLDRPRSGRRAGTPASPSKPTRRRKGNRYAATSPMGFNLHVGAPIQANQRSRLERLLRYMARPPVASERLELLANGHVEVLLKRPRKNGTTSICYAPHAFIARLAALIPPPRFKCLRPFGQFASRGKWHHALRPPLPNAEDINGAEPSPEPPKRNAWANLLKRVHGIDVKKCERCETGRLYIVAVIQDPTVVQALIAAFLQSEQLDPRRLPASYRGPPNRSTTPTDNHQELTLVCEHAA